MLFGCQFVAPNLNKQGALRKWRQGKAYFGQNGGGRVKGEERTEKGHRKESGS